LLTGEGIDWLALGWTRDGTGWSQATAPPPYNRASTTTRALAERDRYIAGAGRRGETAILISPIGGQGNARRNPMSVYDASVSLSLESGSVCGRRLPPGAAVGLAGDLNRADRDLALRLKNRPPATWWTLKMEPSEVVFDGAAAGR